MNNGWISLHRKITKWEWYDDANTFRVFVHCLLLANHEKKSWRGQEIDRGQLVTSQAHLGLDLSLSVQSVRTCLNKLKSTGELTVETTNRFSLISITNYDSLQGIDRQPDTQATGNQQSGNTQATGNQQQTITTTTKELKNDKKKGKKTSRFAPPTIEQINAYIDSKKYHVDGEVFFNHYESNGWMVGKNKMKSWSAALANWNSRDKGKAHTKIKEKRNDEFNRWLDEDDAIDGECNVIN